jgi:sensor domain CHASE-containing protein
VSAGEWLTVIGIAIAVVGGVMAWVRSEIAQQNLNRHALRNELHKMISDIEHELHDDRSRIVRLEVKVLGNGHGNEPRR